MIRRNKNLFVLLSIVVIALLTLAACNTSSGEGAADAEVAPESDSAQASSEERFLDFELSAYQGEDVLGGETVHVSDLLDEGKPIVLNFWAGLCPPCRVEMPDLQETYTEYQDQILLVGVDVGTFTGLGSKEDGLELLEELEVTYPTGTTSNSEVMQAYDVVGMPSTAFITPDGKIHRVWTGLLNKEKMSELVTKLIEESG